jgi:hypothetical protein
MPDNKNSGKPSEDQILQARKRENNPFSEDEKHGPDAHRRSPGDAEEYQGNPSVQRRAPGVEDDNVNQGSEETA